MKVALIGAAGHQSYALDGIRADPSARLAAVAAGAPGEDVAGLASRGAPVYDDFRKMLDREAPDVVSVAPPFHLHYPIARDCLERGIHVFCEKPVALDLADLADLKGVYERSGCRFCGMHAMRYQPNFRAGHDALKAGAVGRPFLITSQKSYTFNPRHPGPCPRPDFYKQRRLYGSTLTWVAIHALDWTYWMVGRLETLFAAHTTEGNFGYGQCESSGIVAFRLPSGGQGSISFDFLRAARDTALQDRCRVAGEKGVIEIFGGDRATLVTHDQPLRDLPLPPASPVFAAFLAEIRGEGECLLSAEDTFAVTRLALLARESADTGRLIRPDDRPLCPRPAATPPES